MRVLRAPDERLLVVLGEGHLKFARTAAIGRDVVSAFELRGVETFQRDRVFLGWLLYLLVAGPRRLLRIASLGAIKGSTVAVAEQLPLGHTVELERNGRVPFGLHVAALYVITFFTVLLAALLGPACVVAPWLDGVGFALQLHMLLLVPALIFRRFAWSWMIHPLVGLLTLRDQLMASGTVRMFAEHGNAHAAVVVMGRLHVQGYTRLLVERFGWRANGDAAQGRTTCR